MAWTYTLSTITPAGSDSPKIIDDRIREAKAAIVERLAVDHYMPLTDSVQTDEAGGQHTKVTLRETTKPTKAANIGFLYVKDVAGATELFFEDASGNEKQLTSGGKLNVALTDIADDLITQAKIEIANNTYLVASNAAGTGDVNLIKANASDTPVLPDGAQLATAAAPNDDADIANKKYVDDQVDTREFGALQTTDSDGDAFVKNVVYLAGSDGTVTWYDQVSSGDLVEGLVGTVNPPTTIVAYFYNSSIGTRSDARSFEVAKGEYWKLVASGGVTSVYWRPRGTGQCSK